MFDQLVESSGKKKDTVTFLGVAIGINALLGITTIFLAAVVVSLFSFSLLSMLPSIDDQDLELTTLVAPPPAPVPEAPKEQPKEQPKTTTQVEDRTIVQRTELQTNVDDTRKVPDKIQTTGNQVPPIPKTGNFVKGDKNVDPTGGAPLGDRNVSGPVNTVPPKPQPTAAPPPDDAPPPPPKPTPVPPKPTPTPTPKPPSTVSGGVVNGKATNLVKPAYPPAAKAVRASGPVSVQVLISESGSVISASAVSGHPLLRAAAEQAARSSKFSPTMLSGQAVKVSGTIIYNFVAP
jgi:TonB family protein